MAAAVAGRTRIAAVVGVVLAVVVSVVGVLPGSQAGADTAAEQREVKRKRADVASQIDTLKASDAQLDTALADLQANVRSTQAQMADAQAEADAATARAEQAEREAVETEARIDQLRSEVVQAAVDAYVDPDGEQALEAFQERSAKDASTKQALLDATNGAKLDVVDTYRSAKQRLDDARAEAEAARAQAEQRGQALTQTKAGYDSALAQQQAVADQVSDRISDKLAESQSLAALDQKLADQLAQEQAALAARLRQVAAAAKSKAAADAAARAASTGGGGSTSGGTTGNSGSSSNGGSSSEGGGTAPVITRPGLSTVRGITVATSIADRLAAMLGAADAAGISLGGSGYRDSSSQIALRRQHCGTSNYAIYQMSPDACRPPTAIPGRSKHEQGLAVDFTANGQIIQSRSSAGFQWLAANAGRFGFVNLPSEPWHWSTDGT